MLTLPSVHCLLTDSAYELSLTLITAYKSPAARILTNIEFEYCLAKAHAQNKHTIGLVLKA